MVATQAERASSLRVTFKSLARLPYVTGMDWFPYFDEPRYGGKDGENCNFGMVDISDRPYIEVTAAFQTADLEKMKLQARSPRPDAASSGIPPVPQDPIAHLAPRQILAD